MIKQIRPAFYHNKRNSQYCCLSTDIIPDYLENGDEVYFIDTGKKYVYDSVSGQLYEKQSGGGGGTSVYPYNNNPEALGHEANPGTSDNYSRGDHIHPLPSVSDLGALPVASLNNIANEFSASSTYAVGDYVIYEGQLYQCTTAVTTAGSWNSSNWVQAVLGNDVGELKSAIDELDTDKEDALSIVQKTSSDVTITLEEDKFYIFPTMTELTVTCPLTGLYGFRFTSGTTPTVFLMSGITMPDNWNGTEASKTYDMTILNGLALVTSWSV